MKLSNIASLWWIRLCARLGQELLALVGIAVGVALLFAALVANASLVGSFQRTMDAVIGQARMQVTARGGGTINEQTAVKVRQLDGVAAAAPVLEMRAQVVGPDGARSVVMIGVTSDYTQINGTITRKFAISYLVQQSGIALPAPVTKALGLALGQEASLNINGVDRRARIAAQLSSDQIGALVDSPISVAPLRYAQELSRQPGRISRIFVLPEEGRDAQVADALRRLAGAELDVRPADFEAQLFRQASEPSNQSMAMFSAFSAMVGFLFAFSAVLLTVPARRLVVSDLLLEGYGGATAMKVMLFDALMLGAAASVVGVGLGEQVSRHVFANPPSFLGLAFPYGTERIVTVSSVALAVLGGVVASCVAVLAPTALAVRAERRGEVGLPVRRRRALSTKLLPVCGGIALATGAAIAFSAPDSVSFALAGLVLLTVAMLVLLPVSVQLLVASVDQLTASLRSVVPYIATTDLRSSTARVRALAVTATGAVAVFGSVALQGAHADLQRGLDRTSVDLSSIGEVWAVPPGDANLLATVPFDAPQVDALSGIDRIDSYRGSFLDIGDRRVWVIGSPTTARHPVPRGQVREGDTALVAPRIRAGGWVVLSTRVASELDVGVGDRVVLPTPVPTSLRVAALTTNLGWPPGTIVLNADDYARLWGSEQVSALQATLSPGTSPEEGARALRAALGPGSGLDVQTSQTRERDQRAASREGLVRLSQIALLVLASAAIAMAAAMAGLIWQRREFLAFVKLEGYSTGEVWRALVVQAALLVGAGCVLGACFGLLGQQLLARALMEVTGFPVDYALAWPNALITCVIVTAVVVLVVALFGRRAAGVEPERGLG
ncbi:ABC transporter permease [Conexibacter sp. JD483]|uniref:ABC transporter permease n=1 Tax=unclassified Conexibacter TaxID=2627773 RepID=UPI0027265DBC|nr:MULTISPECIES: ABC transporter permease [unclassified Conexibacter]MDO8187280.1 ABC transporter permease [Conexibacter sp. CPCC 205706]MDO8198889.1 ABC transporter permease [Conexibacter sp. CPCC 205762]MDR9370628.1 ABC transporter permease [Conexibacter sp. JD483]